MIALTAEAILKIPVDEPERLFTSGLVAREYKALIREWHPDVNSHPKAASVASHLNALKDKAEAIQAAGAWVSRKTGMLSLRGTDGKVRNIAYRKQFSFELGTCYYGDKNVTYVLESQYESMWANALTQLSTLHFANPDMKAEISRYFPPIRSSFKMADGRLVAVFDKPAGIYRLRDVVDLFGGRIPQEATAWIVSSLLNIACYMEWARLSHGDVSMDTVFIDPATHSVYLLGGWWYTTGVGEDLKFLPSRSFRLAPADTVSTKVSDPRTDMLLIKATGRDMLGNPHGTGDSSPMMNFFRWPTLKTAVEDYSFWKDNILPGQFGARRFVELAVKDSDIFKEET